MEKAFGYMLEVGKAYERGHFINSFRAWFDCSTAPISGMPYIPPIPGFGGGIHMSYWNKPPYLGHNPACIPSSYISLTNTQYLPLTQQKGTCKWIGTKYQPIGEDSALLVWILFVTSYVNVTILWKYSANGHTLL